MTKLYLSNMSVFSSTTICDNDKENYHIQGEEWVLLLIKHVLLCLSQEHGTPQSTVNWLHIFEI